MTINLEITFNLFNLMIVKNAKDMFALLNFVLYQKSQYYFANNSQSTYVQL